MNKRRCTLALVVALATTGNALLLNPSTQRLVAQERDAKTDLPAGSRNLVGDKRALGAVGGPKTDTFTIQSGQAITWDKIKFRGLEKASVHVEFGVFGNLILEVFDHLGNQIARDTDAGSVLKVEWTPAFSGDFRIRLTNRDTIAFNCKLKTN